MYTIILHSLGRNKQLSQLPWYWYMPYKLKNNSANHIACLYVPKAYPEQVEVRAKIMSVVQSSGNKNIAFMVTCDITAEFVHTIFPQLRLFEGAKTSYSNMVGCYDEYDRFSMLGLPTAKSMFDRGVKMLCVSFFRKVFEPDAYIVQPEFEHVHLGCETEADQFFRPVLNSDGLLFAAIDLETTRMLKFYDHMQELKLSAGGIIDLVGVTLVFYRGGKYLFRTFTWDFKDWWQYELTRDLCQHKVAKSFHNGGYDVKYLWRWGFSVTNYLWDTQYGFQSATHTLTNKAYALNKAHAAYCRKSRYWKDGIHATTRRDYILYCGKDCHNTAEITLSQLMAVPYETFNNFFVRFRFMGYCLFASMRGFEVEREGLENLVAEIEADVMPARQWVSDITGHAPNSKAMLGYLQDLVTVGRAMNAPDVMDITSTGKSDMLQFSAIHPMYDLLVQKLATSRRNWVNTYLKDSKTGEWKFTTRSEFSMGTQPSLKERLIFLFDLNPFGSKSGRLSSKSSSFWVGFNGQNAPSLIRKILLPPEGSYLVSSDAPQSESRTTAYLSQCWNLIDAVEDERDFHKVNASGFFGVDFDAITYELRETGKRVNHGANYNMQAFMLLMTMGVEAARKAKINLNLPADWSLLDVTGFLMDRFDLRYPEVRSDWYRKLCIEVYKTGRLHVPTGYAPFIVHDPLANKGSLNSIVSMKPQSWSAHISMTMMANLIDFELSGKIPGFRYIQQIHDENVGSVVKGTPIADVDSMMYECGANEFDCGYNLPTGERAVMRIPVGVPVVGRKWSDLKNDELPRDRGDYVEDYLPEV